MKKYLILVVIIQTGILTAYGQQPVALSLEECVKQGIESNYSVRIASNTKDISANNATVSPFLPVLSLNGRQNHENMKSTDVFSSQDNAKKDYKANLYNADITLGWRLFDGMSMFADYNTKRELFSQGELNLRASIESLVADIAVQYYHIVTQQNRLKAVTRYLEISTIRYHQAKEKYLIGSISGLEMTQAKLNMNTDSSRLVLQQEQISNAYIELYNMINCSLNSCGLLSDSISPHNSLVLEALTQSALDNNTSIQLAKSGQILSELDLKVARSGRYPTLDLNTSYILNRSDNSTLTPDFTRKGGITVGFTASMKLFNGMDVSRKVKNAKIGVTNSELNYQQVKQSVESNIMQIFNTYKNNLLMIDFETESSQAASESLEAAMEMYRLGTMSGVEFREVQRNYLQAEERRLDALYQAKKSEIELLYLSGRILN